jgi:hypothetical protein
MLVTPVGAESILIAMSDVIEIRDGNINYIASSVQSTVCHKTVPVLQCNCIEAIFLMISRLDLFRLERETQEEKTRTTSTGTT